MIFTCKEWKLHSQKTDVNQDNSSKCFHKHHVHNKDPMEEDVMEVGPTITDDTKFTQVKKELFHVKKNVQMWPTFSTEGNVKPVYNNIHTVRVKTNKSANNSNIFTLESKAVTFLHLT